MDYTVATVRAFIAVYESRSVSRAAEQLYVTQPSVTYSLKRMRQLFNDELFLRQGAEMVPTAVARSVYPRIREAVGVLDEILREPVGFDPRTSRRTFRLQLTDVGAAVLLPSALSLVAERAPHVRLVVEQLQLTRAPRLAAEGKLDAFVSTTPPLENPELVRDELFEESYVGVCAADHPRLPQQPTVADYLAEGHVTAADDAGHHAVGEVLDSFGTPRDIRVTLNDLLSLPALVANTEYVGYVPRVVAQRTGQPNGVRFFPLPFDTTRTTVSLYTPRRGVASPELHWLRELLLEAFSVEALQEWIGAGESDHAPA